MSERTIDLVERERKRRGLTNVEAAKALGVGKQTYTNWKRRGMPASMDRRAAEFLRCTVDELLGRPATRRGNPQVAESATMYGYDVTEEGARLAREWQKLELGARTAIQTLIESLVAAQVRSERSLKSRGGGTQTIGDRAPSKRQ